jgi:hypothetical protein
MVIEVRDIVRDNKIRMTNSERVNKSEERASDQFSPFSPPHLLFFL